MLKNLPLFPLGLVVYPGENLNLHIFEPRYKQLVQDCQQHSINFGIPPFINKRISNFGTEVQILKIEKVYADGRLDIKTQGLKTFKVLDFQNPWQDKMYAGGEIEEIPINKEGDPIEHQKLVNKLIELFKLLQAKFDNYPDNPAMFTYKIAQKIGLSLEQKYELLTIKTEKERQQYILEHLELAIPIVQEMEQTKQLIRMNGHFKHFDPLNF